MRCAWILTLTHQRWATQLDRLKGCGKVLRRTLVAPSQDTGLLTPVTSAFRISSWTISDTSSCVDPAHSGST